MIQKSDTHKKVKVSEKMKTKTFEMKDFAEVDLLVYDKKVKVSLQALLIIRSKYLNLVEQTKVTNKLD